MATDNTVTLIGNLTDDPELRYTANGAAVANFRLAVTPRVRQGGQWTDGETSFFRINCWRRLAENVTQTLGKGARAIVIGRLRLRSWSRPMRSPPRSSSPPPLPADQRQGGRRRKQGRPVQRRAADLLNRR
jgi:single stranded DNA-binding protein